MPTTHYSRLSSLVSPDAISPILSFIEGGINAIFGKLYYKNLIVNTGYGVVNYQLSLVAHEPLKLKLPGVERVKLVQSIC